MIGTKTTAGVDGADRLLTVREVAARMGVTARQIYRLAAMGKFPRAVRLARSTRWRASDIDLFLAVGCDMQALAAQRGRGALA